MSGLEWSGRRLHLVGIGGAGMSAYARAARALGAEVSGSDSASTPYLERLAAEQIANTHVGHTPENVPAGADVELFYSSAVPADNVERLAARERGIAERGRGELLAELSALRRTVAVAGTHGKTTTAAMLVHAMRGAGLEPGWLIGAEIGDGLPNACWSEGEWLVVEADESDRSMLSLKAEIALVTNAELDHHASYRSLAELLQAFESFLALARRRIVWDRPPLPELAGREAIAYDARDVELLPGGSRSRWRDLEVLLSVPGFHNAVNAAGALEAAAAAGADPPAAVAALRGFRGADRRFQLLGSTASGAEVYDDYAHHPTEVAATIAAARTLPHGRLLAVFQPHLYSRTALLAREFGAALASADAAVLLDVYAARERSEDHPGVGGLLIAEATADASGGRPVYWLPRIADAQAVVPGLLDAGDICLVMGAGDVDRLARGLIAP